MQNNRTHKIIFLGGHLTPALAVLDILAQNKNYQISWIGHKHAQTGNSATSAEFNEVTNRKIPFYNFVAGKLWRKWTLQAFIPGMRATLLIPLGFVYALYLMLKTRPDIVMSFGGYIALPVVIAAKLLGAKVITHEQTLIQGLANRVIARFADKVLISWPKTEGKFDPKKTVFTGNPIRQAVLNVTTDKYKFDDDLPLIYITGGNQGANNLNRRILPVLPKLLQKANIIHQTGNSTVTNDFAKAQEAKAKLPSALQKRYIIEQSIFGPEIGEIFAKADLIFSRSGANTVTEILALGKLAVLMPIPWTSGDEQTKNAKLAESTGLAAYLQQRDELTPQEVYDLLAKGLDCAATKHGFNGEKLEQCRQEGAKLVNLNAAELIVQQINGFF